MSKKQPYHHKGIDAIQSIVERPPQKQAQEQYIRDLAAERGLTTEQLEARIVGDLCGYLPLETANILLGMLEAARRVNTKEDQLS